MILTEVARNGSRICMEFREFEKINRRTIIWRDNKYVQTMRGLIAKIFDCLIDFLSLEFHTGVDPDA